MRELHRILWSLMVALLASFDPVVKAQPALTEFEVVPLLAPPVDTNGISLYPGVAPGSEDAHQAERWEVLSGQRIVRNVVRPVLIPVLPDPAKATGQAVVIAPGGANLMLSIDSEGMLVAKYLAERGVAAFVLKYRLEVSPASGDDFLKVLITRFKSVEGVAPPSQWLGAADTQVAMRLVRARASEWSIKADKVGFIGFSAGALLGHELIRRATPGTVPNFFAAIYGPMDSVRVSAPLPPLFVALAADDPVFGNRGFGLIESWQRSGGKVELHYYERGGHGFGMLPRGTTSDAWIEHFTRWLAAHQH